MPRKDPIWEFVEPEGGVGGMRCKFCQEHFTGGISRMKFHLAMIIGNDVRPCPSVPDDVVEIALKAIQEMKDKPRVNKRRRTIDFSLLPFKQASTTSSSFSFTSDQSETGVIVPSSSSQPNVMELMKKQEKEEADFLAVKFIVANNLAFNVLLSEELQAWCLAIGKHGPGYVPPGSETTNTKILTSLKGEATQYVKSVQETWGDTGCTLMSDSWIDAQNRPHVNLLASSPSGIVFLKCVCVKLEKQTAEYLANFILSGIEEIGPNNVVQVVTTNASSYSAAGAIIEARHPHIFKTSCAAHCIGLILEDIGNLPTVKPIMTSSRLIVNYIYKYKKSVGLMRSLADGRRLKRSGDTRFSCQLLCLQSVLKEKESLNFLVGSNEWQAHKKTNQADFDKVTELIQSADFWFNGTMVLNIVEPLVKVLRMAHSDQSTLGYIYEGMNRVKESIKKMLNDDSEKYGPYWKIIDDRWSRHLHSPIHAVAAYLNPKFYYEKLVKMDDIIRDGFVVVRQRLLTIQERKDLTEEIKFYHSRHSNIFSPMAIDALNNTHPRLWWDIYGSHLPTMRKLAMRLLSQTCSSSACEKNWSAFDVAHSKKRNRLEPKRLHDLVYVRMNLYMQKTSAAKLQENLKPVDLDNIVAFPNPEGEDIEVDDDALDSSDGEDVDDGDDAPNAKLERNDDDEEFDHLMKTCD